MFSLGWYVNMKRRLHDKSRNMAKLIIRDFEVPKVWLSKEECNRANHACGQSES